MTFPLPYYSPHQASPQNIEFVGAAMFKRAGINTGSYAIALNSGLTGGTRSSVQAGDLVIAVHSIGHNAGTSRNPSISDGTTAYTSIANLNADSTSDVSMRVAYKFMGATPDTQTVFGNSGSANFAFATAVYVFSGVSQVTTEDVASVTASATTTALVDAGSITPVTSGAYIVAAGAAGHTAGTGTFTSSDLSSFISQGQADTVSVSMGIGHKAWTSGAFNPSAWSFSLGDNAGYSNVSATIALRPA